MKDLISIAWRNIWRNKRRTAITIASIFFAVFFALIMRSMQLGTYGHMIDQSIEKFSGYLQVQNPEYFDDPSLDNYLDYSGELIQTIQQTEGISIAVPRIEAFVLASSGHQSKGVMVTGIDPVQELQVSNPEHLLVKYRLTPEIVTKIMHETTFDKNQTSAMVDEIDQLNRKMIDENRKYILIGPGRWGTRDRWIGIPVRWPQISNAAVIIETSLQDYPLDGSSGSHFFHNVTAMNVGYYSIQQEFSTSFINKDLFKKQEIVNQTKYFKHIRFKKPLLIRMDGKKQDMVITTEPKPL